MLRSAFTKYPILTNSVIYGTLYVAAEFSQQTLTRKVLRKSKLPIDKRAVVCFGAMGTFAISPILTLWYRWLDKKYAGKTVKIIAKKLLLDQFVLTPPLLVLFYVGMSFMEGKKDVLEECRRKFVATFGTSCMFWLPAQTINFMLVPPTFRVVYIGSCAFVWVNILCWIKRQNAAK